MIKALFFDLDGTLLTTEKVISPKTRKTLIKCKEKEIRLFIATARPPLLTRMLSWDKATMSLFDGGSYYNGGCIEISKQKIYTPISDKIVQKAIDYVMDYNNLNIALQLENEKHAFRFPLEVKGYKSWGVDSGEALSLSQAQNLKSVKILIFFSNLIDSVTLIDDKLVALLKVLCLNTAQFYLTDKGKCVQIMAKSINKMNSIERIRQTFRFEKDEIAVFGDDVNDIEMLSEYPYSIAMGNAEQQVMESAKYITLDNNNEGIHHAICNILHLV